MSRKLLLMGLLVVSSSTLAWAEKPSVESVRPYAYETKPDAPELAGYFPALAPKSFDLILKEGDRLAIVGDSITEQKMYSRIIENYLTACVPHMNVTVRQYGWSGEKTDGFLNRMERDCLTFEPTIATICYGMNDARYRPFDVTNGRWYKDHYSAIVKKFHANGVRTVVGSPGCSGKLATWVQSKSGTLDEHNQHLCALRDIALEVAIENKSPFADIFWPMMQQRVLAPKRLGKTQDEFAVAGKDGIHPGWAGQVIMAYAFLEAMGLDGDLGTFHVPVRSADSSVTGQHKIVESEVGRCRIESRQYAYCVEGENNDDNSVRAGASLVPFHEKLNRMVLVVPDAKPDEMIEVTWGGITIAVDGETAKKGFNLATTFLENPFLPHFKNVDAAVLAKQTYETKQIKEEFRSPAAKEDFAKVVEKTEAVRQPLADAVKAAMVPVVHEIRVAISQPAED